MANVSRRTFLKQSLAFAGATFVVGTAARPVLGANNRIHVGVAGIRGRGSNHISEFQGMKDVQVTYLIDIDTRTFGSQLGGMEGRFIKEIMKERGVKEIQVPKDAKPEEKKQLEAERAKQMADLKKLIEPGRMPRCVQDVRRALEDQELDALSIATPNHWHSLMTIWACQASKDVYVEKPCSHNVFEGRKAVEAARKFNRIVQHGTQSRSVASWARIVEIAKSGQLGKLLVSHGYASKPRGAIRLADKLPPASEVDLNLFLGPAQESECPEYRGAYQYIWHWFWAFGNGEIGNQGVHEMDKARWGIPGATLPKGVLSLGGRFGYVDPGQTPNTQIAVFDYGEGQPILVFESCGLVDGQTSRVSNDFHFEAGVIRGGAKFFPKDGGGKDAPLPKIEGKLGPDSKSHFANFIAAVRSRKREDLNADILEGHYSSALCHLANISYRLGRDVGFAETQRAFGERAYANEAWAKLQEHLVQNRKLDLAQLQCHLGKALRFDPEKEKFIDDAEADRLLTRNYRAPFVVPEQV
jgi:predicted dehydrogenase